MTPLKRPFEPIVLRSSLGMFLGSLASTVLRRNPPRLIPSNLIEIRPMSRPRWGFGLFAKQPIQPGTVILEEDPLMTVPLVPQGQLTLYDRDSVNKAFNALSMDRQIQVWSLASSTGQPDEEIRLGGDRLLAILALNAFNRTGGGDTPHSVSDLYHAGSRFNHSCVPNVQNSLLSEESGGMDFRVSRGVEQDEELTISYIDKETPFVVRQEILMNVYGFSCRCPACDPDDSRVDSQAHEQRLHRIRTQGTVRSDVAFDSGTLTLRRGVGRAALEQALERATARYEALAGLFPPQARDEALAALEIINELSRITKDPALQPRRYSLYKQAMDATIAVFGPHHADTVYLQSMLSRMTRNIFARGTPKSRPASTDMWKTTDGMGKMSPRTRRVVSDILG